MTKPFRVEVSTDDGIGTVRAAGEIDLSAAERLEGALRDVERGSQVIVLDLRDVTFIDSTGLRTITSADARARHGGYEFKIVRGSEQVQKLLHLTGMDKILPLVDDPADTPGPV
jgi:anti-anti-sigma factor